MPVHSDMQFVNFRLKLHKLSHKQKATIIAALQIAMGNVEKN